MDSFRHPSRCDATALKVAAIAFAVLVGSGVGAKAESPAALVEDIQGKVTGAEFMDYVVPGQVIKIGTTGSVVLRLARPPADRRISIDPQHISLATIMTASSSPTRAPASRPRWAAC